MLFQRYENNPVIQKTPGSFYSVYSAKPDIVFLMVDIPYILGDKMKTGMIR